MDSLMLKHQKPDNDDQRRVGVILSTQFSERAFRNNNNHRRWCGESGAFLDFHPEVLEHPYRGSLVNGLCGIETELETARALNVVGKPVPVIVGGFAASAPGKQKENQKPPHDIRMTHGN